MIIMIEQMMFDEVITEIVNLKLVKECRGEVNQGSLHVSNVVRLDTMLGIAKA